MELLANEILNRLNNLVVVIDQQGSLQYVNPAVQHVLGFAPGELLGTAWWNETQHDNRTRHDLRLALRLYQRQPQQTLSFERGLFTSGGELKHIHWQITRGPQNTIIGIGYDVTERKIAELQLENSNRLLNQQHQEVVSSLQYAQRIQEAILPGTGRIKRALTDAFVWYQPKDIVSGDFYWTHVNGDELYIAVADCTGHGVPGAMMSVMANALLKDVIVKRNFSDPAQALTEIDNDLQVMLNEGNDEHKRDGMDLVIIKINTVTFAAEFASAMRPLLLMRNGEITEFRGDKYPIGFFDHVQKEFITQQLQLQRGDRLYLFTDGYTDQFGGDQGKKFNKVRLRELIHSSSEMGMDEQRAFLEYAFTNWKQQEEQTDDVLILGIEV